MGKGNIIIGFVLIIAAIYGQTTDMFQETATITQAEDFKDSYPYNGNWSKNGSLNNLVQENQKLVIDNKEEKATYASEKQLFNGSIKFNRLVSQGEFTNTTAQSIKLTLYSTDRQGAVIDSQKFNVSSTKTLHQVNTSSEAEGYFFEADFETTNNQSPKLELINVEGEVQKEADREYGMGTLIFAFMIFMGLWIMKG